MEFYLLDVSESTKEVSHKLRQWAIAELEQTDALVSLIFFNYYPHEITTRPIELSQRNLSCLKFYINEFNIIGGTNLLPAIKCCLRQVIREREIPLDNFKIKIITDGAINNPQAILNKKFLGKPIKENVELLIYNKL